MKILITGVTGFKNRGVEALVAPVIERLLVKDPNWHFEIASWTKDYDAARFSHFGDVVNFVPDCFLTTGEWGQRAESGSRGSLASKVLRKAKSKLGVPQALPSARPQENLLPYRKPDLVMMSGGDLICSDYGTNTLRHFLEPVHWAHAHGIPCALIGQSIGKFTCDEDIAIWKAAEKKATLITVREPLTKRYLVGELGSDPEKIHETSDCAFLLSPDEKLADIHRSLKQSPLVGLSISESICKWTSADYDAHVDAWADIAGRIINEWHARVVMIPHVQDPGSDDRVTSTKVWRKLGFDPRISLAGGDLSASEFKGILSTCDMVIAERMHAAIGALSTGVPTIPIGYSIKAEGIITQIFQATDINPQSAVMPMRDFIDVAVSWPKLDQFWRNREACARTIQTRLPALRASAQMNFELLAGLV
jgi:colanic acid/amylovoran biosynthesis protein